MQVSSATRQDVRALTPGPVTVLVKVQRRTPSTKSAKRSTLTRVSGVPLPPKARKGASKPGLRRTSSTKSAERSAQTGSQAYVFHQNRGKRAPKPGLRRTSSTKTAKTTHRAHVAAEAIIALTRLRGVIIDRITAALQDWSPQPVHASLFGSFARGEATTDSDIDVLVVVDPAADADTVEEAVDRLDADVRRWTGNAAHIVGRKPDTLAVMVAADDPLVRSWRADHIDLIGTRLLDLLRDVRWVS
jgi:predicted nucleotidyltransferase